MNEWLHSKLQAFCTLIRKNTWLFWQDKTCLFPRLRHSKKCKRVLVTKQVIVVFLSVHLKQYLEAIFPSQWPNSYQYILFVTVQGSWESTQVLCKVISVRLLSGSCINHVISFGTQHALDLPCIKMIANVVNLKTRFWPLHCI